MRAGAVAKSATRPSPSNNADSPRALMDASLRSVLDPYSKKKAATLMSRAEKSSSPQRHRGPQRATEKDHREKQYLCDPSLWPSVDLCVSVVNSQNCRRDHRRVINHRSILK